MPISSHKLRKFVTPRPSPESRGYGTRHRKLRLIVLREEPICRVCGKEPATDMDHIDGDVNNVARSNLQGLCKLCHGRKTVREQGALGGK